VNGTGPESSPDSSRRLGWAVAGFGALAAVAAIAARKLSDFDLPWHLAFGRLVVERRSLVTVDELAYTERPIRLAEYVGDVALYAVEWCLGPLGLQVLGGVLALATAALLMRASRRGGPLGFVVVAVAMAAMQAWLLVRPATISFALLALVMVAIGEHRDAADRGDPGGGRRLFWFVPIFAVWANVHGFVVLGLVLLWGYALYAASCRALRGKLGALAPEAHGAGAGRVALVAVLCLLASLCNRAGPALLMAPFVAASTDFGRISEWDTTTLSFMMHEAPLAGLVAVAALAGLAFGREPDAGGAKGSRLPALFDVGLVALALVLARTAVRMVPIALIFVTPIVARRIGALSPRSRWSALAYPFATWIVAPFMIATSAVGRGIGFDPAHFSEGSIRFILAAKPAGHVYDSAPIGGWLEWRLFPLYRVLIDGRRTGLVHDPELVATYQASETEPRAFAELLSRFDFQWAAVIAAEGERFGTPIARSPEWAMVYWDDTAAIYVRADGPNAEIARHGYRLLRHQTDAADVFTSALARDRTARELARDARLAESQAPESPRAAFLEGCGAIADGDKTELDAAIARLARLEPGHPGVALLAHGWEAAEERAKGQ
jgi:hypothetical protein